MPGLSDQYIAVTAKEKRHARPQADDSSVGLSAGRVRSGPRARDPALHGECTAAGAGRRQAGRRAFPCRLVSDLQGAGKGFQRPARRSATQGHHPAGRQLRQRAGTEEGHEREVAVGGRGFPGQQGNRPHRRRNQARQDQGRLGDGPLTGHGNRFLRSPVACACCRRPVDAQSLRLSAPAVGGGRQPAGEPHRSAVHGAGHGGLVCPDRSAARRGWSRAGDRWRKRPVRRGLAVAAAGGGNAGAGAERALHPPHDAVGERRRWLVEPDQRDLPGRLLPAGGIARAGLEPVFRSPADFGNHPRGQRGGSPARDHDPGSVRPGCGGTADCRRLRVARRIRPHARLGARPHQVPQERLRRAARPAGRCHPDELGQAPRSPGDPLPA